ncbi:hypothetical protein HDV00_003480 [Rhizophlyctis rosea]|nr:hypothetical protein HDV00_003480 [Rhizophlyctis rosea]
MVKSSIVGAALFASLVSAAPLVERDYGYGYEKVEYEGKFPVCKYKVEKPAWDPNGRGYGWENGKSCIIKKEYTQGYSNHYESDNQKDYSKGYQKDYQTSYDYYTPKKSYTPKTSYFRPAFARPANNYQQQYQQPSYQQYQQPSYQQYQQPTYQQPSYTPPSYDSYAPKDSYSKPQCSKDYYDGTYADCGETYTYLKKHYCPSYAGDAAGNCITELSKLFDKCISGVDKGKGYCWDAKYFTSKSSSGYGYQQPSSYGYQQTQQKSYFKYKNNAQPAPTPSYQQQYQQQYQTPSYPAYQTPSYPAYQTPSYPAYQTPSYPAYQTPSSYQTPAYQPPSSYQTPTYQPPKSYQTPTYQAPSSYQTPTYQAPSSYQTPTYQAPSSYQTPSYQQPPSYDSYQKPSYDSYQQPSSSGPSDCKSAVPYFEATGSPTLKQCISIVCGAPGQTEAYKIRGIEQCAALKKQAEATNGGQLPKGW